MGAGPAGSLRIGALRRLECAPFAWGAAFWKAQVHFVASLNGVAFKRVCQHLGELVSEIQGSVLLEIFRTSTVIHLILYRQRGFW